MLLSQLTSSSSLPTFCTVCVLLGVHCCTGVTLFVCLFVFYGGFVLPCAFLNRGWLPAQLPAGSRRCLGGMPAWSHTQCLIPLLFHCHGIAFPRHGSVGLRGHPAILFLDPPALSSELPCSPSPPLRGWNTSVGSAGLGFSLQISCGPQWELLFGTIAWHEAKNITCLSIPQQTHCGTSSASLKSNSHSYYIHFPKRGELYNTPKFSTRGKASAGL